MNHRFQFHKRGQLFIRAHNETLSVSASGLAAIALQFLGAL